MDRGEATSLRSHTLTIRREYKSSRNTMKNGVTRDAFLSEERFGRVKQRLQFMRSTAQDFGPQYMVRETTEYAFVHLIRPYYLRVEEGDRGRTKHCYSFDHSPSCFAIVIDSLATFVSILARTQYLPST